MKKKGHVLLTGVAGFIGFHMATRLLEEGWAVTGIDNLNAYYEVSLKEARLRLLKKYPSFTFERMDIGHKEALFDLFSRHPFEMVVHLAAQAGVRYSLQKPYLYGESNLMGFLHILEACRKASIAHLLYASSSSIYGANTHHSYAEQDMTDSPISLYGATKKSNELMAYAYSHLYALRVTGLRFFTVYGPYGRPDMAIFRFTRAILGAKPIEVYNHGNMQRDFTYIDDAVADVLQLMSTPHAASSPPYRIYNIGSCHPVSLKALIAMLEDALHKKAKKKWMPLQEGDMVATCADTKALDKVLGVRTQTPLKTGISHFVKWYKRFYTPHNSI